MEQPLSALPAPFNDIERKPQIGKGLKRDGLTTNLACQISYADTRTKGMVMATSNHAMRIQLTQRIVKVKRVTVTLAPAGLSFSGEIRWRRGKTVIVDILKSHNKNNGQDIQ